MLLTPWEEERLLIFAAAELARRHRAAGIPLNAPEAVALVCDAMLEAARAGAAYAEVERAGLAAISPDELMPGVRELVPEIRLEVLLGDGSRLVVLQDPLAAGRPRSADGPGAIRQAIGVAGAADVPDGADPTADLERRTLVVESTSRRVIRVSSHFPFDRVNSRLQFDRAAAAGFRLDLPAGSSERWGPGETRTVRLVRFRGSSGRPGSGAGSGSGAGGS